MKKALITAVALYLLASCIFSIMHAHSNNQAEFRTHRNGLLCIEYTKYNETEADFIIYSPFCNWSGICLFGISWVDVDGWTESYSYGDGFDHFGEWWI